MFRILRATHFSHIGNVRKTNEDSLDFDRSKRFFVVADGISGLPDGEVASEAATSAAMKAKHADPVTHTFQAFHLASMAVKRHRGKMGTTMVSLAFDRPKRTAVIGNCGDSRAYRLRDGKLERLTTDQRHGNMLYNVLTTYSHCEPVIKLTSVKSGDVFLLCSDGVTNELDKDTLTTLVSRFGAQRVVRAAIGGPGLGRDNASAIIVRVSDMSDR